MPLTNCLFGPGFSITGARYFMDNQTSFQVNFNSLTDQESVLAYQWYLDDTLVADQSGATFNSKVSCGEHTLGLRLLSNDGWSGVKTLQFTTCKVPTSIMLYGPAIIDEGSTTKYYVLQLFSDGSNIDISEQYTFLSSAGGVFNGSTFNAAASPNDYDDITVTISAVKEGAETLTKQVVIHNTTTVTLVSLELYGPSDMNNGESALYGVIAHYSNGAQRDVSDDFVFASSEGAFIGKRYTVSIGATKDEVRKVTISALQNGFVKVSKQINVHIDVQKAGILVVDLFNDTTLNVVGLIEKPVLGEVRMLAHTGNNIIPVGVAPESALILASDLNVSSLTRRFEFNIEKLIRDYPDAENLAFDLKGRSVNKGKLAGAFSLKTRGAKMALNGSPGSYMPTVVGGTNVSPITDFVANISGGANGSYAENDLFSFIKFNYHVPTSTLTYVLPPPQVEIKEFDFMAIRYNWLEGAGNDLDILVGFENTATSHDSKYVGFGQRRVVVPEGTEPPVNAYLWWATDNRGASGYEGVLVGMKRFLTDLPNAPDIIEVGLYASWFGGAVTGDFSVELVTYKGGTMSKQGTNFVNTDGIVVSSNVFHVNTKLKAIDSANVSGYYKVGTLRYNKTTASAVIQI